MELFDKYQQINDDFEAGNIALARNDLIKTLNYHEKNEIKYNVVINHLIRRAGLFPYMQLAYASWDDRFTYESFKVDIGKSEPIALHREQSRVLKKLLEGKNLAISAPTSFGKSFIIDSFIAIKNPKNIVIIVPTIALTDETRRRLQQKFSDKYKIITTTDIEPSEQNIFIFPQERAINYVNKLESIDLLIIDEFYKASVAFDKERAPALVRAMLKLSKLSTQKYYLAPNISKLNDNPFTKDMEFEKLDYNTVFLKIKNLYEKIGKDEEKKGLFLLQILERYPGKTLIYAGTYTNIEKVSTLIIDNHIIKESPLLVDFEKWLIKNYDPNWTLPKLIKRGVGIHNGRMHRSLSQIQIKLFEEDNGIDRIISTSSIIEGVNTSAENVIIWRNKNGRAALNDFTYKNIIGRGGRMFRHFVGNIFVLEPPPSDEQTQLNLFVPDEIVNDLDEIEEKSILTKEQVSQIIEYKTEMKSLLGEDGYNLFKKDAVLQTSDYELVLDIAREISSDPVSWRRLAFLNSDNPEKWDQMLYKLIDFQPGNWGVSYRQFVGFIKALSFNWTMPFPEILRKIEYLDLGINEIFQLERVLSFQFASLLQDVNTIQKIIINDPIIDISPFVYNISHAFLPKIVYQLEEYGLPRMISRKINSQHIINLENSEIEVNEIIKQFSIIGLEELLKLKSLDAFEKYILIYFFDGITIAK